MVTTTINQLSLPWLILILVSPYFVVNQGQGLKKDQILLQYWLSSCFLDGFNLENLTSTDCESLKLVKNENRVPEFENNCLGYYKLGCALGQKHSFCNFGISKVISDYPRNTNFSCTDMELLEDVENISFDCCITCKRGLIDANLNDKCIVRNSLNQLNLPDQAQQRCCKAAVSFANNVVNLTSVQPDSPLSSGNFTNDEMSRIAMENDSKIDTALAQLGNRNQSNIENVTDSLTTSEPLLIENVTSSFDGNNVTSDTLNISTTVFATTTELTTTINETDSVVNESLTTSKSIDSTSNIKPKEVIPTTTESETLSYSGSDVTNSPDSVLCGTGYQVVNGKCEDINECESLDTCRGENETCFNIESSFRCCPKGTELTEKDSHDYECAYIDQCEKNPCYQDENDQHWCVNYFSERECIDKLTEGYQFLKGNMGIQRLIGRKNKLLPLYLELSQIEVMLKGDVEDYDNHGLVKLELPKGIKCDWKFSLDQVWSPYETEKIYKDQFTTKPEQDKYFVYINGQVKPQSVAISLTCHTNDQPYYRNTIYFTFKPKVT